MRSMRPSARWCSMTKRRNTSAYLTKYSRRPGDKKVEIGRILHFKSESRNPKLDSVQFEISAFGFEMQDSSNFNFHPSCDACVVLGGGRRLSFVRGCRFEDWADAYEYL